MKPRTLIVIQACLMGLSILSHAERISLPLGNVADRTLLTADIGKDDFKHVSLRGQSGATSQPGFPELPIITHQFLLPQGARKISVSIVNARYSVLDSNAFLRPAQPPVPLNGEAKTCWLPPDSSAYASESPYPVAPCRLDRISARGEYLLVSVEVYPFKYYPAQRRLEALSAGELVVEYQTVDLPQYLAPRRTQNTSGECQDLALRSSEGPGPVVDKRVPLPEGGNFRSLVENLPDQPFDYLIITSAELAESFAPLAEWRTRRGQRTQLQTVEWIIQNSPGADIQEKIRNYIKACWLYGGAQYVLLGGDTGIIPERQVYYVNSYLPDNRVPSDLYYADIVDTSFASGFWSYNFNLNRNVNFGEIPDNCGQDDGIDQTPDLFLGRAPVQNAEQAVNFVSKVIFYEQAPAAGFADRLLILADGNFAWFGETADQIIGASAPWTLRHRMYNPVSGGYYTGDEVLTVNNGLARLDQGYHIVYHFDHGGQYTLSLAKDHSSAGGGWIYRPQAAALQNTDRHSIVITPACSPNAYDFSSISEYLINNPRGGALAFIGNSRVGWTSQYPQFNRFFEALYQQGESRLGNIFAAMVAAGNSYGRYALNLLGDPAMSVYSRQPAAIAAIHPQKLAGPQAELPVALGPLSYGQTQALVCLSRGQEVIDKRFIASGSSDTFRLSGLAEGWLYLTVSVPDHITYLDSCYYVPGPDSIPLFSGYLLQDSTGGNGDGVANPGESILLYPRYNKNIVTEIRLRSLDPALAVEDSILPAYVSPQNEQKGYLRIGISPDIKRDRRVPIQFVIRSQGTPDLQTYTQYLDIASDSLMLGFASYRSDPSASADRDWYLLDSLQLANIGRGAARDIKIWLPGSDTFSIGDIPAGSAILYLAPIGFHLSSPVLILTAFDAYGRRTEFPLSLSWVPEPPQMLTAEPGPNYIRLGWSQTDTALSGFNIYRKGPGQERFEKLNQFPLRQKIFVDEQVLPLVLYSYTVTAISRSGRESQPAEKIMSAANPKISNGFPQTLGQGSTGTRMWSSPASGDINGDGSEEVVLGSDDGLIYVFDHQGRSLPGWPKDLGNNPYGRRIIIENSSPALADLDGDGCLEIIMGNGPWYGDVGDGLVHAWRYDGSELPGWPQPVAGNAFAPASADDIDGDGWPEVVAVSSSGWLYLWDHQGNLLPGWPIQIGATRAMSSAALGDLNGDGTKEIVAAANDNGNLKLWVINKEGQSWAGWPKVLQNGAVHVLSSPVLADMDGDGDLEMVLASEKNTSGISYVYCLKNDGSYLEGWPYALSFSPIYSSPALGDLDGDDHPEVVLLSGDGVLYSLSHRNGPFINWSAPAPPNGRGTPVIADVNADGLLEVMVATEDGYLRAVDGQEGHSIAGFPIWIEPSWSAPLVSDIDGDGKLNLIAFGWGRHNLCVWELISKDLPGVVAWGRLGCDQGHTGCFINAENSEGVYMSSVASVSSPVIPLIEGDYKIYPNPANVKCIINFQLLKQSMTGIDIYNLAGQKVKTLVSTIMGPGRYHVTWNIDADNSSKVAAGTYFCLMKAGPSKSIYKLAVIK